LAELVGGAVIEENVVDETNELRLAGKNGFNWVQSLDGLDEIVRRDSLISESPHGNIRSPRVLPPAPPRKSVYRFIVLG